MSTDGRAGRHLCKRCGWCCQNQLIGVSTVEIRAIDDFISKRCGEELEDHVISCLAYEGNFNLYGVDFRNRMNDILNFFVPCETELFEGGTALVRTRVIRLLSNSMRCIFNNPVSSSCFIYPARPLTCRMFPYEVENDHLIMVDETDECPGIGLGEVVDIRRHRRLSAMCKQLLHEDNDVFWRFVREKGLMWRGKGKLDSLSAAKLIDPFVELGRIPQARSIKGIEGQLLPS